MRSSTEPGAALWVSLEPMTPGEVAKSTFQWMTPEESAAMSGASWGLTFRRVVLPLLKPGLLAGWIYVLIVSIRELSSSILLYSPGTEVVSIVIWELWQNGQYVELSALGVMLIVLLFCLVMIAQFLGKRFGISEG